MVRKQAANSIVTKKDRKYLMCKLTPEEISQASDDLARHLDEQEAIKNEMDALKSQFKGKLELAQANINTKKRLVRDKREMRYVDVEVVSDYTECTIRVTRLDTGETIEDRKMTGDETQLKIEFDEESEAGNA